MDVASAPHDAPASRGETRRTFAHPECRVFRFTRQQHRFVLVVPGRRPFPNRGRGRRADMWLLHVAIEGYRDLDPTHVVLEMAIVPYAVAGSRPRLAWSDQPRVYPIRREHASEVLGGEDPLDTEVVDADPGEVGAWCRGCGTCPCWPTCELATRRIAWEPKRPKAQPPAS